MAKDDHSNPCEQKTCCDLKLLSFVPSKHFAQVYMNHTPSANSAVVTQTYKLLVHFTRERKP